MPQPIQQPMQPASQPPQAPRDAATPAASAASALAGHGGWQTLLKKEVLRFWRVALQTIAAPVLTAAMYLLVFSHALDGRPPVYPGVGYAAFLVPGLVMMALLQNAFANSASSLVQSKIMGNLVFVLLTPLSGWHWFVAYVGAAVLRGLLVGLGVYAATLLWVPVQMAQPLWVLAFALLGAALMGALGVVAGLWADKFDQMASFQNFVIMPLTFLSGVFYSIHSLPGIWQRLSHLNPFFYLIDGLRHGFFGASDVSPWRSLAVAVLALAAISALALHLLRTGYKLRN